VVPYDPESFRVLYQGCRCGKSNVYQTSERGGGDEGESESESETSKSWREYERERQKEGGVRTISLSG